MPLKMRTVKLHSVARDGNGEVEPAGCGRALGGAQAPAALAAPGPAASLQSGSHPVERSRNRERVRGPSPPTLQGGIASDASGAGREALSTLNRWLSPAPPGL